MRVVVVGGSSSVGRATIDAFSRYGRADVLPTYTSRPIDHPRAAWLDVTDEASIAAFVRGPLARFGAVDVAVFLSGVLPGRDLAAYRSEDFDRTMATNVTGQARLIQALLPCLADGSLLLLTSSISAERGSYDPIYAASKGALVALAKSLAAQLAPKTRTNVVSPGLIEGSSMCEAMTPERRDHHRRQTPSGELVQLADLARVLVDLTRPHWRSLNGAVIALNGGAHV